MIDPEVAARILRLHLVEKWKIGTIARELGVHHNTVSGVLQRNGLPPAPSTPRRIMAEPYLPFLRETLAKHPRLPASRLFHMVKARGYPGGEDHFRSVVAKLRPRPSAEAYLRLKTLPGEEAQTDWASFGKITIGNVQRSLVAFVMVLSWSRRIFLRFYLNARMASFLRGHVEAFEFFGGVPRRNLYDNLKSAVLERRGDAIRFNPRLLELAAYYRFEPRPVDVYRGNQKGRVERSIRYIRGSFFAAREYVDLADLNRQALDWCLTLASERRWPEDHARTVGEVFAEEKALLLPLRDPFPAAEIVVASVGKTPYLRFDLNDYSVPHTHVRRELTVVADEERVRVFDGTTLLADHPRSYERRRQIEDPQHIKELVAMKREARASSGLDRLQAAAPSVALLMKRSAEQGGNLGSLTSSLLHLLDRYGPASLEHAIAGALHADRVHLGAIKHLLDQAHHDRGQSPPVALELNEASARVAPVRPHALEAYDFSKEFDHE